MHFKISYVFNDKECLACKDEVPDSKKSNSTDGAGGGVTSGGSGIGIGGIGSGGVGSGTGGIVIKIDRCKALAGDIKIEFYGKNMMRNRKKLFSFWFNTYFVSEKSGTGEPILPINL